MPPLASRRSRAQFLIVVLGIGVAIALAPYLSGLFGAAILYVICAPAYRRLSITIAPRAAAAVVVVAAAVLLLLPGAWLINLIIAQAPTTLQSLQDNILLARLARLRIDNVEVGAQIANAGGSFLSWLSGQAIGFFGSATRGALNLVIAFFGLYYLLLSAPHVWERIAPLLPFSRPSAEVLRERFQSVTEAMLLGTALTAVLQGAIIGVGFWLVGLPSAAFWGVIAAIASILPVLGSALVWLPGVLVLLVGHRYGAAVALAVIGAGLASNIDNVIRPIIYRRVSDIHPLTTLVGAFAGVSLFGLIGLLLGPLAISYFFELVRLYELEYGHGAEAPAVTGETAHLDTAPSAPVANVDGG
jgi:predicted PurR-regulated permease PerM